MVCHRCGKSLSSEMATCPFCGMLLTSEQLKEFKQMNAEKGIDLQPKLLSEKYGMPVRQYVKDARTNGHLLVILGLCVIVAFLFVIVIFILF